MKYKFLAVGLILASGMAFVSTMSTVAQARSVYTTFACKYHHERSTPIQYVVVVGSATPCPPAPPHRHTLHEVLDREYSGPECIIREPFD